MPKFYVDAHEAYPVLSLTPLDDMKARGGRERQTAVRIEKHGKYIELSTSSYADFKRVSDTPDERWDHYRFVREARGAVLVSGLGLGMCLGAVLRKPEVERVTVLEISQDLIDLVAPHYADPRVEVVCADALAWRPPRGAHYGAVWHDIWPNMSEDNLPQMATLNRRYARRAAWKGCWGQERIVAQRERERRSGWGF